MTKATYDADASGKVDAAENIALTSQAAGDVAYFDGSQWVRLAKDEGKFLKSGASAVSWDTPAGGSSTACDTAIGTDDVALETSVYVLMPNMSITATTAAGVASVVFTGPIMPDLTTVTCDVAIFVDDVQKTELKIEATDKNIPAALSWAGTLTAGEHTIQVRWKAADAMGMPYQKGSSVGARFLTVISGMN